MENKDVVTAIIADEASELNTTEDSNLQKLGLDSLGLINVAAAIEHELSIHIPDAKTEKWETVRDVIETVEEISNEKRK